MSVPPRDSTSTLAALRFPEFRLLFAGLLPAGIGFWMQEFALGWLVVQVAVRDGDPSLAGFYLGLRGLASALPSLFVGLVAGVYADRVDRRAMLLRTRFASAAVAIVLAFFILLDQVNIVVIMVLSAASAAAYVFDPPTRQAILPRVVPTAALFSAMGLMRAALQASQTFGPLLGGLIIVPFGIASVVLGKVVLMLTSAAMLFPMRSQPIEAHDGPTGVLGSLREGLAHMRDDELIRWCMVLQIAFAVLAQSFIQLLPAVAVETLAVGPVELSWLVGAVGAGTVLGAFLLARLGRVEHRGALVLGLMIAVGTTLILLGLQRGLPGALALAVVLGILFQMFMGTLAVILQLGAPDRLRGRVMGTQAVIFQGVGPIGVLVVGTIGTLVGVSLAILGAGVALVIIAIAVGLRVAVIRDLRRSGEPIPAA